MSSWPVLVASFIVPLLRCNRYLQSGHTLSKLSMLRTAASFALVGTPRLRLPRGVLPYLFSWALSAARADHPRVALRGSYLRMSGLLEILCFVVLRGSRGGKKHVKIALVLAGIGATVSALIQHRAEPAGRACGTLGNSIFYGGYMAMMLPIVLQRALSSPGRWLGAAAVSALFAWGLLVSRSRGALLGAAAGLAAMFLRLRSAKRWWLLLFVAPPLLHRLRGIQWKSNRPNIWWDALRAWWSRPVVGWGNDNIVEAMDRAKSPATHLGEPGALYDRTHNHYLDELTMRGLLGLVSYGYLAGSGLVAAWTSGDASVVGLQVAYHVQNVTGIPTASTSLAWWLLL